MASGGGSAKSTDSRLKVEFARRKNRRASITEQYVVPVARSRRKERLAQTRHYEFLVQPENLAAVHEIVAHVQRLADSEALALGHVLSPMDKHRLHMWAHEVTALTTQFEPSSIHESDPLLLLLEQLQALQEGHECLAEVAIEARQVVEKWERSGVFDDSKSSEDEDEDDGDDDGDAETPLLDTRSPQQRALDYEREKRRKMEASYAYRRVRERAAAHMIKRNTLRWVRSRAAFRSRVEELEVFGNTTAGLLEELTAVSDLQRRAALSSASNSNDINDLVKAKKNVSGGHKIDFSDLMLFSKHLALFTVDHALRRVGAIETKRRLFQQRCLIKLQTWWRKMHEIVKGRRMLKLLEDMRRKKDQEREAELQRQHELKAKAASAKIAEANSRKAAKAVAKTAKPASGTAPAASAGASSSSRSVASPKADADASTRSLTSTSGTKAKDRGATQAKDAKSVMPTPPSTPKASTISSGGGASTKPKKHSVAGASKDDKMDKIARAARAREARLRKEFEEELKRRELEDEEAAQDTEDVEAAWRRFMESAQIAEPEPTSDGEDERVSTASSGASTGAESRGLTPYTTADGEEGGVEEWKEWSDDEDRAFSEQDSRVTTPHSSVSSRLSTPRSTGTSARPPSNDGLRNEVTRRPVPPSKGAVAKKRPPPRRALPQTPVAPNPNVENATALPAEPEITEDDRLLLPYAAAPSPSRRQLLFGTSQARHSRPALPGTGQLSKFMPFAEQTVESPRIETSPVVFATSPRRHLHEIDFLQSQADASAGLDMFLLAQPLFEEPPTTEDVVEHEVPSDQAQQVASSTVRVFSSVRANRIARMRAALEARRLESPTRPPTASDPKAVAKEKENDLTSGEGEVISVPSTATLEPFVVFNNEVREALLRPIRGRASMVAAYISNPMLKLDFRKEDVMRKPDAAEVPNEETESPEPETSESNTTAEPTKAKFGSHTEWLRSMGLENSMALAARGPNQSPQPSARQPRKIEPQAQLATSMLTLEATKTNRAKQRRKKEHALPLLGRRSPRQKKPAMKAPVIAPPEEQPRPSLPPVVERKMVTATPPPAEEKRRRRHSKRRSTRKAIEKPTADTHQETELPVEEHQESSIRDDSSDPESSYASDLNSEDEEASEATETSGDESQESAQDGGSEVDASDSDATQGETKADSLEIPGSPGRRPSRRARRSVHASNQRKRSSLHAPRHVKKRRKNKQKSPQTVEDGTQDDPAKDTYGEKQSSSVDICDKKKASGRFRPHMSSLFRRLAPKCSRVSFDLHRSEHEDDDVLLDTFDDHHSPHEVGVSDEGESEDPARTAAFFKLYSQYMGLLSAAPTPIVGGYT